MKTTLLSLILLLLALAPLSSSPTQASEQLLDFWDAPLQTLSFGPVESTSRRATQPRFSLRFDQAKCGAFSIEPTVPGHVTVNTDLWGLPMVVPASAAVEFWLRPRSGGEPPLEARVEITRVDGQKAALTARQERREDGWAHFRGVMGNLEAVVVTSVQLDPGRDPILLDGLVFRTDTRVLGITDKPLSQWVAEAAASRPRRVRAAIEAGTRSDFSGEMRQLFDRLWMGELVVESNERLRQLLQEDLDAMRRGSQDTWSLSTNVRLFQFYYELGSKSGRPHPPLEPRTERLLLEVLWERTRHKNDIGWAGSNTWWMTGSENHDLNAKVSNLVSSRIFMNEPEYRDLLYPDEAHGPGHGYWFHTVDDDRRTYGPTTAAPWKPSGQFTAAEHYRAWVSFFDRYLTERARRGFFLENASPGYQKWSLGFLLALRRYGGDEALKQKLTSFFDLVWADWAQMQLAGLRGGPKTRHHYGVGGYDSMTDMARFYLGGAGSTNHLYSAMVLDDYTLPEVVVDLVLDTRGRGHYAAVARGIGEEEATRPRPEGMERTLMNDTHSRFLKYAWVTPQYILGTQMDHPDAVHSHLSAAGRWHGLVVAGQPDLRIVPTGGPEAGDDRNGARTDMEVMYLTAQSANVLVGQQARRWSQISPQWFPSQPMYQKPVYLHVGVGWDETVEQGGWLFVRKGDAYAAVREVAARRSEQPSGRLNLRPDIPVEGSEVLVQIEERPAARSEGGGSLVLGDRFNPFIIHAGSRDEHGDFAQFRAIVSSSRLELHKTVVPGFYTVLYQGAEPAAQEIMFPAATPEVPRISGQPIDYRPARLFESPFLQSDFGSGMLTIRKGSRELKLDFLAGRRAEPEAETRAMLQQRFEETSRMPWALRFSDPGTSGWEQKWALDGEVAKVRNTPQGIELTSGPEPRNDAHHCVLWTRDSFSGDVKIEFEFTRLDEARDGVNILYLQATGSGKGPYAEDILAWSDLRKVPAMRLYFDHMNTYHISYAVGYPGSEYVRARRYVPESQGLEGTDIAPDYGRTDLFQTGVPHRMTVIKRGREIMMQVRAGERQEVYHWINDRLDPIEHGRVGLRQMGGKRSVYRDFSVYEAAESGGARR